MARHIFLTGPKQVGKTTLLRAALADFPGSVGGFCTLRTRAYLGDAWSVHLLRPGRGEAPGPQNLLFVCGAADGETAEADTEAGRVRVGGREYSFDGYTGFIAELVEAGGLMNLVREGRF